MATSGQTFEVWWEYDLKCPHHMQTIGYLREMMMRVLTDLFWLFHESSCAPQYVACSQLHFNNPAKKIPREGKFIILCDICFCKFPFTELFHIIDLTCCDFISILSSKANVGNLFLLRNNARMGEEMGRKWIPICLFPHSSNVHHCWVGLGLDHEAENAAPLG